LRILEKGGFLVNDADISSASTGTLPVLDDVEERKDKEALWDKL
jgi:hypothetical protein